jgi:ABC-type lipoprotein release transport system permease subunit
VLLDVDHVVDVVVVVDVVHDIWWTFTFEVTISSTIHTFVGAVVGRLLLLFLQNVSALLKFGCHCTYWVEGVGAIPLAL